MLNEIRINSTNDGMTVKMFVKKMMMSSARPPTYPATRPSVNPIEVAMSPAIKPISSDTPVARANWVATSRPKLSVPRGKIRTFASSLTFT